jgi:hypothetical protein
VGLDRRLEPIDGSTALNETHGVQHGLLVADVLHLFVVRQPAAKVVVERGLAALADGRHGGAHLGERANEELLIDGKTGLDEDDVHGQGSRRAKSCS